MPLAQPESATPRDILTVILPTKGQRPLLKGFLRHGLDTAKYRLIVADGSLDDSVKDEINRIAPPNTTYVRFPADTNRKTYLDKLVGAAQYVRTPFAMIANIDDYVLTDGVEEALSMLETSPDLAAAGCGVVVEQAWHWARTWRPVQTFACSTTEGRSLASEIKNMVSHFGAIPTTHYHVHRTSALVATTTMYSRVAPGRPFADQYFALCSLSNGRIARTNSAHYAHTAVRFLPPSRFTPQPLEAYNLDKDSVDRWYHEFVELGSMVMGSWPAWAESWASHLRQHDPMITTTGRLNSLNAALARFPLNPAKQRVVANALVVRPIAYAKSVSALASGQTIGLMRAQFRPDPARLDPSAGDEA